MSKAIQVGSRVRYSTAWLRSTGQYAGDICHAKGVVTEIKDYGGLKLASVDWGNSDIPGRVATCNLSVIK